MKNERNGKLRRLLDSEEENLLEVGTMVITCIKPKRKVYTVVENSG